MKYEGYFCAIQMFWMAFDQYGPLNLVTHASGVTFENLHDFSPRQNVKKEL